MKPKDSRAFTESEWLAIRRWMGKLKHVIRDMPHHRVAQLANLPKRERPVEFPACPVRNVDANAIYQIRKLYFNK